MNNMTDITVASKFDVIYYRALEANHIPFLLESKYDYDMEMWTTTFTIKTEDWQRARTAMEQARKENIA